VAALDYPFAPPEPAREIAAGLLWLRLPVPGSLAHINVWLIEDGEAWLLVDTGMATEATRAAWAGPLHAVLGGRRIARILCTHHHPDHAGLAAELAQRHGAQVLMSRGEDEVFARIALLWQGGERERAQLAAWAAEGLAPSPELLPYLTLKAYGRVVAGRPTVARHLADGDIVEAGAFRFTCRVARGHSDEQLLLVDAPRRILIAGDQLLPRISPNIGVYPERADPNPLRSYLDSLATLAGFGADWLVLPSHGLPYRGLPARVAELIAHHEEMLATLGTLLARPASASELALRLFPGVDGPLDQLLALGETLAHLRCLESAGRVERRAGPVALYTRA
jgi:glyoxylase-like metal-dependent hydrolase (beta-lactamase superfamily II)